MNPEDAEQQRLLRQYQARSDGPKAPSLGEVFSRACRDIYGSDKAKAFLAKAQDNFNRLCDGEQPLRCRWCQSTSHYSPACPVLR